MAAVPPSIIGSVSYLLLIGAVYLVLFFVISLGWLAAKAAGWIRKREQIVQFDLLTAFGFSYILNWAESLSSLVSGAAGRAYNFFLAHWRLILTVIVVLWGVGNLVALNQVYIVKYTNSAWESYAESPSATSYVDRYLLNPIVRGFFFLGLVFWEVAFSTVQLLFNAVGYTLLETLHKIGGIMRVLSTLWQILIDFQSELINVIMSEGRINSFAQTGIAFTQIPVLVQDLGQELCEAANPLWVAFGTRSDLGALAASIDNFLQVPFAVLFTYKRWGESQEQIQSLLTNTSAPYWFAAKASELCAQSVDPARCRSAIAVPQCFIRTFNVTYIMRPMREFVSNFATYLDSILQVFLFDNFRCLATTHASIDSLTRRYMHPIDSSDVHYEQSVETLAVLEQGGDGTFNYIWQNPGTLSVVFKSKTFLEGLAGSNSMFVYILKNPFLALYHGTGMLISGTSSALYVVMQLTEDVSNTIFSVWQRGRFCFPIETDFTEFYYLVARNVIKFRQMWLWYLDNAMPEVPAIVSNLTLALLGSTFRIVHWIVYVFFSNTYTVTIQGGLRLNYSTTELWYFNRINYDRTCILCFDQPYTDMELLLRGVNISEVASFNNSFPRAPDLAAWMDVANFFNGGVMSETGAILESIISKSGAAHIVAEFNDLVASLLELVQQPLKGFPGTLLNTRRAYNPDASVAFVPSTSGIANCSAPIDPLNCILESPPLHANWRVDKCTQFGCVPQACDLLDETCCTIQPDRRCYSLDPQTRVSTRCYSMAASICSPAADHTQYYGLTPAVCRVDAAPACCFQPEWASASRKRIPEPCFAAGGTPAYCWASSQNFLRPLVPHFNTTYSYFRNSSDLINTTMDNPCSPDFPLHLYAYTPLACLDRAHGRTPPACCLNGSALVADICFAPPSLRPQWCTNPILGECAHGTTRVIDVFRLTSYENASQFGLPHLARRQRRSARVRAVSDAKDAVTLGLEIVVRTSGTITLASTQIGYGLVDGAAQWLVNIELESGRTWDRSTHSAEIFIARFAAGFDILFAYLLDDSLACDMVNWVVSSINPDAERCTSRNQTNPPYPCDYCIAAEHAVQLGLHTVEAVVYGILDTFTANNEFIPLLDTKLMVIEGDVAQFVSRSAAVALDIGAKSLSNDPEHLPPQMAVFADVFSQLVGKIVDVVLGLYRVLRAFVDTSYTAISTGDGTDVFRSTAGSIFHDLLLPMLHASRLAADMLQSLIGPEVCDYTNPQTCTFHDKVWISPVVYYPTWLVEEMLTSFVSLSSKDVVQTLGTLLNAFLGVTVHMIEFVMGDASALHEFGKDIKIFFEDTSPIWDGMKKIVGELWNMIVNWFAPYMRDVWNIFLDFPRRVAGLWNGLKGEAWNWLRDKICGMSKALKKLACRRRQINEIDSELLQSLFGGPFPVNSEMNNTNALDTLPALMPGGEFWVRRFVLTDFFDRPGAWNGYSRCDLLMHSVIGNSDYQDPLSNDGTPWSSLDMLTQGEIWTCYLNSRIPFLFLPKDVAEDVPYDLGTNTFKAGYPFVLNVIRNLFYATKIPNVNTTWTETEWEQAIYTANEPDLNISTAGIVTGRVQHVKITAFVIAKVFDLVKSFRTTPPPYVPRARRTLQPVDRPKLPAPPVLVHSLGTFVATRQTISDIRFARSRPTPAPARRTTGTWWQYNTNEPSCDLLHTNQCTLADNLVADFRAHAKNIGNMFNSTFIYTFKRFADTWIYGGNADNNNHPWPPGRRPWHGFSELPVHLSTQVFYPPEVAALKNEIVLEIDGSEPTNKEILDAWAWAYKYIPLFGIVLGDDPLHVPRVLVEWVLTPDGSFVSLIDDLTLCSPHMDCENNRKIKSPVWAAIAVGAMFLLVNFYVPTSSSLVSVLFTLSTANIALQAWIYLAYGVQPACHLNPVALFLGPVGKNLHTEKWNRPLRRVAGVAFSALSIPIPPHCAANDLYDIVAPALRWPRIPWCTDFVVFENSTFGSMPSEVFNCSAPGRFEDSMFAATWVLYQISPQILDFVQWGDQMHIITPRDEYLARWRLDAAKPPQARAFPSTCLALTCLGFNFRFLATMGVWLFDITVLAAAAISASIVALFIVAIGAITLTMGTLLLQAVVTEKPAEKMSDIEESPPQYVSSHEDWEKHVSSKMSEGMRRRRDAHKPRDFY